MTVVTSTAILLFLIAVFMYNTVAVYKWRRKRSGEQNKSEAEHYYWKFFYYNPGDHCLVKSRGGGYTINFGRSSAIIVTGLILSGYIAALIYL